MSYYFSKRLRTSFTEAIERVTAALEAAGFGVLTEIDVRATLKRKLDVEFRPYTILGACNPQMAHRALQSEPMIGAMLPCNVVVQEVGGGEVEVAAVDPVASMKAIENPALGAVALEVQGMLRAVISGL
jgi:uncharacterized protein (DUF302 family)